MFGKYIKWLKGRGVKTNNERKYSTLGYMDQNGREKMEEIINGDEILTREQKDAIILLLDKVKKHPILLDYKYESEFWKEGEVRVKFVPITSTKWQTVKILGKETELIQTGDFSKTKMQSVATTIYSLTMKENELVEVFREDKKYKGSEEMEKTIENSIETINKHESIKELPLNGEKGGELMKLEEKFTKNKKFSEFVKEKGEYKKRMEMEKWIRETKKMEGKEVTKDIKLTIDD
jgi:hypothetical protein